MCTVSFLALEDGFILSSNRDESPKRGKALDPQEYQVKDHLLFFPKDPEAHGSWICTSEFRTICLLNGGFEKHDRTPPYRKSRGIVVLDSFDYPNIQEFYTSYDFTDIEPFTLIFVDHNGSISLSKLIWDGKKVYKEDLDHKTNHIWASSTLYNERMRTNRMTWFNEWLKDQNEFNVQSIMDFHYKAGNGDPHENLLLDRPLVKTLSITSIEYNDELHELNYFDVFENSKKSFVINTIRI